MKKPSERVEELLREDHLDHEIMTTHDPIDCRKCNRQVELIRIVRSLEEALEEIVDWDGDGDPMNVVNHASRALRAAWVRE